MAVIERNHMIEGALPPLAFKSAVTTATGAAQSIAHGLGRIPSFVLVLPVNVGSAEAWTVTEGTHTTTNVVVTVAGTVATYRVFAW